MISLDSTAGLLFLSFMILLGSFLIIFRRKEKSWNFLAHFLICGAIVLMFMYIVLLCKNLHRPPVQTLIETQVLYSFFFLAIGYILYIALNYDWICSFSFLISFLLLISHIINFEIKDNNYIPEVLNKWYFAHVLLFVLSYSLFIISFFQGIKGLISIYFAKKQHVNLIKTYIFLYLGLAVLSLGFLFGIFWVQSSYGHYWIWELKEIWAFITWFIYILFIHFANNHMDKWKTNLWILTLIHLVILLSWVAINYIPAIDQFFHLYLKIPS